MSLIQTFPDGGGGSGGNSGVQIPAIVGTKFHYNGTAQAPVITGFDSTHCTVTGTTSATDIGQYTITISLSEGLSWSDGTSAAKTYTYEIIPIGVKYTPTDDVQTWLACAEIWDKTSYTTLADVLADSDTLETLLANGNAIDYLVRSTTWISSICSDEDTMTAIGDSDVCADKLLENYEWIVGIYNSTYFESVLNVKVPTMTSNTTPSGVVSSDIVLNDNYPWKAFDNNTTTYWIGNDQVSPQGISSEHWIEYEFAQNTKCYYATIMPRERTTIIEWSIKGSNDRSTWATLESGTTIEGGTNEEIILSTNINNYKYYRLYLKARNESQGNGNMPQIAEIQFYGRASSSIQPVDMPYEASSLSYLRDVVITNPKDGQSIYYNKTNGKWENGSSAYLVPWSTGTEEQITNMINGYYNGRITLADIKSVWSIGDVRNIEISAIAASGGSDATAWSVGESHRAQTVQVQILDFDHDTLETAINNKTKALITVDLKNCLRDASVSDTNGSSNTENGYMNSTNTNVGGWKSSARRAWCNNAFYNALPSYIQLLVKTVVKITGKGGRSSATETTNDRIFLSSEREVYGTNDYAASGEGTQYKLYETATNRIKYPKWSSSTDSGYAWFRTPHSGNNTAFLFLSSATAVNGNPASNIYSIAPAMCL